MIHGIILIIIGIFLQFVAIYLQAGSLNTKFKKIIKSNIEDIKRNSEDLEKEKKKSISDSSIKNKLKQKIKKAKDSGTFREFTVDDYEKLNEIIDKDALENRIPNFNREQKIIFLLVSIGIIFQIAGIAWQQIEFIDLVVSFGNEITFLKEELKELKLLFHVGE